jgi:orotate phosphoribosyltransferase
MATQMPDDLRELARNYINDKCFLRAPEGSAWLPRSSGKPGFSRWMIYLRRAMYDPTIMAIIAADFFNRFGGVLQKREVQLAGVENSAVPLLCAFSMYAQQHKVPINIFSIRKDKKQHGAQNWVEGAVTKQTVLLVDDLTSQGHVTTNHALNVLAGYKLPVWPSTYSVIYKTRHPSRTITWQDKTLSVSSMFCLLDFDPTYEEYHEKIRTLRGKT